MGRGERPGVWGPALGAEELGVLRRLSRPRDGGGEIKAEGEGRERFVANGTRMFFIWVLDFLTDPVFSYIKEVIGW